MQQQNKPDKAPLDEVMMAMDVVDTLRHQKLLVDRELNSEEREQKLIERLRNIYAAQGIEVPDSILVEGVKALEDDRFTYTQHAPGLQTRLARIYIERGKWSRRLGLLALVVALVWGAWYWLVTLPEQRRIGEAVTQFNAQVDETTSRLQQVKRKLQYLRETLSKPLGEIPADFSAATQRTSRRAAKSLDEAAAFIDTAEVQGHDVLALTADNYAQQSELQQQAQSQRERHIGDAQSSLSVAERIIDGLSRLADLPAQLAAERDAITKIARVNEAKTLADQQYESALATLRAGDIEAAMSLYSGLKSLRHELASSYTLRVVSHPGERSGVWRIPDNSPGAKNYYLIVEALDAAGNILTLPVINEEDGKTYSVNKWGLRVAHSVYQRVAADKQDDGIIQKRRIGSKKSGFVEPKYTIATAGGKITSW